MANSRRDTEKQLASMVMQLHTLGERISHLFASQHGMYSSDFRALTLIDSHERAGQQLTAGELAQLLSLSSGAVTYLVERLTSGGFILRLTDPDDRRKLLLGCTPEGRRLTQDYRTPMSSICQLGLSDQPDEELESAARVASHLLRSLEVMHTELSANEPSELRRRR